MRSWMLIACLALCTSAAAQQEATPPLSGPTVDETRVPGVVQQFGEGTDRIGMASRPIPQRIYEAIFRKLVGDETPEADRLTEDQQAALKEIRDDHEAAVREYTSEHQDELRRIRRTLAAAGEGGMVEEEAVASARRRGEEIRRGAPSLAASQKLAWMVLTDRQHDIVEAELERYRERIAQREAEEYAQRRIRQMEAESANAPPARPAAGTHPLLARFREELMALPPEERAEVLRSLRQMLGESDRRPASRLPESGRDKPAPAMDEVEVPEPQSPRR